MFQASFALVLISTLPLAAYGAVSGNVYLPDSQPPVLLYRYRMTEKKTDQSRTVETQFLLQDGTAAVQETLEYRSGQLVSYTVDRKREGRVDSLAVSGGNVDFLTTIKSTGKRQTERDDWDKNHIVLPELLDFALANWDRAMSGASVSFRLAIVEKRDTYGFYLRKDQENGIDGKATVTFKVAPSSFFVSLALSPVYLVFDKTTRKLISLRGLKLPHPDAGPNEIRDIEADVVYLVD